MQSVSTCKVEPRLIPAADSDIHGQLVVLHMGPEKITDTTQFPDDGREALERFVEPDTLSEIDALVLDRFSPDQEVDFSDLPDFSDWVGIRHKRQISSLLELLSPGSIHYCWRWSESLKEHHTPKWLESELTVGAEVIRRVCTHLTTVYAAPFIHKAMKKNDQVPIVKYGELRSGHESRLRIACDDFRGLVAEKQPAVYSDGRLGEPPEWMLLLGDRGLEQRFANAAGLVASVIGLERADDPYRDGLFLWLDFVSQEPDEGYSLSYEIEEWRDQEPIVTIEGQFTKTGVVELSLRVATRLHYEVMGLADTEVTGSIDLSPRSIAELTEAFKAGFREAALMRAHEAPTEPTHANSATLEEENAPAGTAEVQAPEFPDRAEWARNIVAEGGWQTTAAAALNLGIDPRTLRKILHSISVRSDVLEKLADALLIDLAQIPST